MRRVPAILCPEQKTLVWMQDPHKVPSHLSSLSKHIHLLHPATRQFLGTFQSYASSAHRARTHPEKHMNLSSNQPDSGQHTSGHTTAPWSLPGISMAQQQASLPQNPSASKLKVCSSSPLLTVVIGVSPQSQGDIWGH